MLMGMPPKIPPDDAGAPKSPAPFVNPIDWLAAENARYRALCITLGQVAILPIAPPAKLRKLATMVTAIKELQIADEADDLFPRLRERMESDDDITRTLRVLSADHDAERWAADDLRVALIAAADAGIGPSAWPGLAMQIEEFVTRKRRHIALVNAVLLPIARLRLTLDDQSAMARTMAERRIRPAVS